MSDLTVRFEDYDFADEHLVWHGDGPDFSLPLALGTGAAWVLIFAVMLAVAS